MRKIALDHLQSDRPAHSYSKPFHDRALNRDLNFLTVGIHLFQRMETVPVGLIFLCIYDSGRI